MSKIKWLLAALGMAVIGLVPVLASSSSANASRARLTGRIASVGGRGGLVLRREPVASGG